MDKKTIFTFPNILSISRILLSPIIFLINDNKLILFVVLLLIGLTDVLDGYIARKYQIQTIIGAWLDSIADFVFYMLMTVYTIIFEFDIVYKFKYFIVIIIGIKLLTIIIGSIKYKKLGFLHTLGNKTSGIIIFMGFCIFILLENSIIMNIGIILSIISSLEELCIIIMGKEYKENIKGIWELK